MSFILLYETKYYSFHAFADKEELAYANNVDAQEFNFSCLVYKRHIVDSVKEISFLWDNAQTEGRDGGLNSLHSCMISIKLL